MALDINPYIGIHNKVRGKTRVIKRFVWWKKLEGELKFLQTAYILQRCLPNQFAIDTASTSKKYLEWYDVRYTYEPTLFIKCDCGNELTTSGSFVSDNEQGVTYQCTDCRNYSLWNFDIAPVPVKSDRIFIDGVWVKPCVGCGYCCITANCGAFSTPECPALIWDQDKQRHFCKLCLLPGKIGKDFRDSLYIGKGCCSNLNTWRNNIINRTNTK